MGCIFSWFECLYSPSQSNLTFLHKATVASENITTDTLYLMLFIWYVNIFSTVMMLLDWKGVSWLAVISYYIYHILEFLLQCVLLVCLQFLENGADVLSGGGATLVGLFIAAVFLWILHYAYWVLAKVLLFGNSVLFSLLNVAFDALKSIEGTVLGSFPISNGVHAVANSLSEVLISATIRIFLYYGGTVDEPVELPLAATQPSDMFSKQNVTAGAANASDIKSEYHPWGSWDFIADFYTMLFIFSWALGISIILGLTVHPVLRPTYFIPTGCILATLILQANDDPEDQTRIKAYMQWLTVVALPYLLFSYLLKLYRQQLAMHAHPDDYGHEFRNRNECCTSISALRECGAEWQRSLLLLSFPCREFTYATMRECHCVADGFYNQCRCCKKQILSNETLDFIDQRNLNPLMCCLMSKAELDSAKIEEHVIIHVRPHHLCTRCCPTPSHLLRWSEAGAVNRFTNRDDGSSSWSSLNADSTNSTATEASTHDEEEAALVRPTLMRTASSKVRRSDTNEVVFYEDSCIICMEPYQEQDELRILQCGHVFHKNCSEEWLKMKHTCPLCKKYVPSSRIGEITHALFA